jgi:hypothetical protein
MRSTVGEIEFWKSLRTPVTPEIIAERFSLTGAVRSSFEQILEQAHRAFDFCFLPETDDDSRKGDDGADPIWTRTDYVVTGQLSADLLRKIDLILTLIDRRRRRNETAANLLNALAEDWLPSIPLRAGIAVDFDKSENQASLTLKRAPRGPIIDAHLLHLRAALEQVEAHCQLYSKRGIDHWEGAIWPLFLFARDDLGMKATASFGRGHNPPDHLRAEWDRSAEGGKQFYPIPTTPLQKFLFDCMRLIDGDRARTTVLRSLLTYWVAPVVREGEPPPKLQRRKKRTSISKGVP